MRVTAVSHLAREHDRREADGQPVPAGREPHLGIGLYIVRLIAEFHGGSAVAANRADGGGAIFSITLPLI